jgi:hypothetical protein
LAGEVKARGDRRRARSDWMAIERERGISVSSEVMSFEHEGLAFNRSTRRVTRISARKAIARWPRSTARLWLDTVAWHHGGIEERGRKLLPFVALSISSVVPF